MSTSSPVTARPAAGGGAASPCWEQPAQRPTLRVLGLGVPAVLLLAGILVVALLAGGGAPQAPLPGLPDAGAVTGWGGPLVDLVVRGLAVLTIGQLTYAALLSPTGTGTATARALRGATWSACAWLVAELTALVLTASSVHGVPVTGLSPQAVLLLPTQLPAGRSAAWVVGLLTLVIAGSARSVREGAREGRGRTRTGPVALLLVALAAAVLPGVLAGHPAAADDHLPAVVALSVHVVTASLWVGGLVGLLLHGRHRPDTVAAVRRFSTLALACVVLLLTSGMVSALLVAGPPSASWAGEGWVRLLLLKTVLLGLLTAVGWWHRRRTMPALADGAPRAFVRLGVAEVVLMGLTVTLSVALAASPAPTAGATEDMSGHDHGELSVAILVDEDRFHVAGTVRPGQAVTVHNPSTSAATISAVDGSFDVDVRPRTIITFVAPAEPGDYDFVSRAGGSADGRSPDTLRVRAGP